MKNHKLKNYCSRWQLEWTKYKQYNINKNHLMYTQYIISTSCKNDITRQLNNYIDASCIWQFTLHGSMLSYESHDEILYQTSQFSPLYLSKFW